MTEPQSVDGGPSLPTQRQYVLTIPVVTAAIRTLQSARIHEAFVAYLHIRHLAARHERTTDLPVDWGWDGEVSQWLQVPGGPPNKPHFRPFKSRGREEESSSYWLGKNLAGSYATSSLRAMRPLLWDSERKYRLPLAYDGKPPIVITLEKFLYGNKAPAWALSAFLYRNNVFYSQAPQLQPSDLLAAFRKDFNWTSEEIQTHFDWELPDLNNGEWFVPWESEEVTS